MLQSAGSSQDRLKIMLNRLDNFILESWPTFGLGERPAGGLRWLLINGGISVQSKLVALGWQADERWPCLVAKFARYPRYNARLQTEYAALTTLQTFLPDKLPHVPRPLALTELDGLTLTVETALVGKPLRAYLQGQPKHGWPEAGLTDFVGWLGRMQAKSATVADLSQLEAFVFEPIKAARTELDLSEAEAVGLTRLEALADRLSKTEPLPLVFNHNDLGPHNVLVDEAGRYAGLIDWESGAVGLPGSDLVYFFRLWEREQGLSRAELETSSLKKYHQTLGMSAEWLPITTGLGWVWHARNERQHLLTLAAEGQVLHGKPAAVRAVRTDRQTLQAGFFRSQLGTFLANFDNTALEVERARAGL